MRLLIASLSMMLTLPALSAQSRPNILLLMAEDMSPRVGAFGDAVAVTPNIDALADQGVRYTHTFTTAGVCAPSRAAHILGRHQISTGGQHMRTGSRPAGQYYAVPPPAVKAYPELLRAAGYYTYTDQKLDYQFAGVFPGSGPFTIWSDEGQAAPDWRGRAPGQPFFGFRNFMVTHESGVFRPLGSVPNSVTHLIMQVMRWWRLDETPATVVAPGEVQLPPYYPDTAAVRSDLARHYNNIAYMDAEVGTILAQLEEDGLADSTIVIWTTDHGDGLARAKRELYDSGLKVPLVIRWPEAYRPAGVTPGMVDTRLISFIDLAPTILGLAGVSPPDYLQGSDFASLDAPQRSYIMASRDRIDEVPDRQRAIRDRRFKYIRSWHPQQPGGHKLAFRDNLEMVRDMRARYAAGELNAAQRAWFEAPGKERLFDLKIDPFELKDVSADPQYVLDLERLRTALNHRLGQVGDWSEEPEAAMAERFTPSGEQPLTPKPDVELRGGLLYLRSANGASIGYRLGQGPWQVYTAPVALPPGPQGVVAKAVRYGWQESPLVVVR